MEQAGEDFVVAQPLLLRPGAPLVAPAIGIGDRRIERGVGVGKPLRAGVVEVGQGAFFEASNGADALEVLGRHPEIDTVVADFTMPQMNGAQLVWRIHKQRGEIPILLVTGYASGDLDLALPPLTKPFRQSELAEALAGLWNVSEVEA